jgi:hypothetical protein
VRPLENQIPVPEWRKDSRYGGTRLVAYCKGIYVWDATNPDGTTADKFIAGKVIPNRPGGRCVRPSASGTESRGRMTPIVRSRQFLGKYYAASLS